MEEVDTDEEIFGLPTVNEPKSTPITKSVTFTQSTTASKRQAPK
jgi:hypothetical protein